MTSGALPARPAVLRYRIPSPTIGSSTSPLANLQGLYVSGAGYARSDVLLSEVFVEPDLVVSPTAPGTALGHDRFTDASATIEAAFRIAIAAAVSKAASGIGRSDARR